MVIGGLVALGAASLDLLRGLGRAALFLGSASARLLSPPWRPSRTVRQIHSIGARSLLIILPTALFTGMVLALQGWFSLRRFGAERLLGVGADSFGASLRDAVQWSDVSGGLWKAASFAVIIGWICSYKGFFCRPGAAGVAKATTSAVVLSSVLVLVWDWFMTSVLWG